MEIDQYQIVLVNLDPTLGSEIKKTRPCVVISPIEMNKYLRTIVRTIDKLRIIKLLGRLSKPEIKELKNIIRETFVD